MSGYNSYVGELASREERSTVQKYMGDFGSDPNRKFRDELDERTYRYNNEIFVNLIYKTLLSNIHSFISGDLASWFHEHESDIVSRFAKLNEECLDDESFSLAIQNNTEYCKVINEINNYVFFHPSNGVGSTTQHAVKIRLLYVPCVDEHGPNVIRLEVNECLYDKNEPEQQNMPFIKYYVDFGDDERIYFAKPVMIISKKEENNIIELASAPCDMSVAHVKIDKGNLRDKPGTHIVRDVLMELFEKSGIKEKRDGKGY